ncbi:NrdR family transcriptional regulator [Picosynechococcus sp. PCC 11901]|uniref:NrdR family transcriptional regulator n=1 Tax=Picosynechococcus sp. PCC 11901 TaxID=2579791 RepID=UPI0026A60A6A
MYCPKCHGGTRVPDSRTTAQGQTRRRKCLVCGYCFTTYERPKSLLDEKVLDTEKTKMIAHALIFEMERLSAELFKVFGEIQESGCTDNNTGIDL